jgi:serine/threonine protein kinase
VPEFIGTQRFQVHRRLGAGGFGVVYEAFDRERNARVALKTLARLDPGALYRFKREFRTLADVSHENLVELHELVSVGEQWFFTMELIAGVDFLSHCRGRDAAATHVSPFTATAVADAGSIPSSGQLATADAVAAPAAEHEPAPCDVGRLRPALLQLARGVASLHALGILHRDIKPSNVLVNDKGRVVLVDFGIATELNRPDRTEVGIAGTPQYMAPEQGAGLALTESADWYAVGCVLYEALTGRMPFAGAPMQILMDKQQRLPPRPRELRIDTPTDLDELCMALLRTQPDTRPSGAEVLARLNGDGSGDSRRTSVPDPSTVSAPSLSMPFVGRREALATLASAFRTVQDGHASTVFVHGHSGMGKSALVQHFFDVVGEPGSKRAEIGRDWLGDDVRRDAIVLAGRCYERESVPYKAFDSLVDALTRQLVASERADVDRWAPRDARILARVFPVLMRVPSIAEARRLTREIVDPQQLRTRAFGALRELLARMAAERPLVVFIDDLQWGDADSAALLAGLTAPPHPPALLLILGYRKEAEETSDVLRALRDAGVGRDDDPSVHSISVEALDDDDACALARMLLGGDDEATAKIIAKESQGSPFFIGELVRHVKTSAPLAAGTGLKLESVLRDRLSALPEGALRLLEIASIGAGPVPLGVAYRAAGLEAEQRAGAIGVLRAGHLVRASGSRAADRLEPFHDRIRETVTSTLEGEALAERHRQLAFALTESEHADPEALYVHFRAGGLDDRAAEHAEASAAKAARALAFDRAADFYRIALDLLPGDSSRVHALRVMLGDALANAGRGPEAAAAYMLATEGATPFEQLDLRRRAAEQLLCTGHIDKGLDVIQAVLGRVEMRLASTPLGAVIALVICRFWLALRGLRFKERAAATIAPAALSRIDVCWSTAVGLALVDTVRAAQFSSKHLALSLSSGEPARLSRALALEAGFIGTMGTSGDARAQKLLGAARPLAVETNHPETTALIDTSAGVTHYFNGRFPRARDALTMSLASYQEKGVGTRWELDSGEIFLLGSLVYLGEFRALWERLPGVMREAQDRNDLYMLTYLRIGEMNVAWLVADDAAAARAHVDDTMARWSRRSFQVQHWDGLRSGCQVDLYEGNALAAEEKVRGLWRDLEASLLFRCQLLKGVALHLRARCYLGAARLDGDLRRLSTVDRDVRKLRRERAPWASGLADVLAAAAADLRGQREECVRRLRASIDAFDTVEMKLHAAAARRRLAAMVDDDERARLKAHCEAYMEREGVKAPDKTIEMMAPGFVDALTAGG